MKWTIIHLYVGEGGDHVCSLGKVTTGYVAQPADYNGRKRPVYPTEQSAREILAAQNRHVSDWVGHVIPIDDGEQPS